MSSYREEFNTTTQRHRQRGASVIKVLVLIPLAFVVVLALAFAFYEGRKAYWDHRVQQMCEKDGGTHIFERVILSREEAKAAGILVRGNLVIPPYSKRPPKSGYYIEYESTNIRASAPRVFRSRTRLVRAVDLKVLAERVGYSRVGSDFPSHAHPSSSRCHGSDEMILEFRTAIQIKEETE